MSSLRYEFCPWSVDLINIVIPSTGHVDLLLLCTELDARQKVHKNYIHPITGRHLGWGSAPSLYNAHHEKIDLKVHKNTWTFEHEFLKMISMSNVHERAMHLACYLYRVSIQKVPRIFIQKMWKKLKNHIFLLKSHRNNINQKDNHRMVIV